MARTITVAVLAWAFAGTEPIGATPGDEPRI
jgi:hypothetical protein